MSARPLARAVLAGLVLPALLAAPALGQEPRSVEGRTREIVRRVVPFDGRSTQVVGEEVTVTLDGDVLFEFDEATLTPQAEATLAELADDLADRATGEASIVGHTDSVGTDAYNLDLSRRRARAVEAFLGPRVDGAVTFAVDGRGEAEPVAANERPDGSDDPDGRRRNRRVEVTFTATEG